MSAVDTFHKRSWLVKSHISLSLVLNKCSRWPACSGTLIHNLPKLHHTALGAPSVLSNMKTVASFVTLSLLLPLLSSAAPVPQGELSVITFLTLKLIVANPNYAGWEKFQHVRSFAVRLTASFCAEVFWISQREARRLQPALVPQVRLCLAIFFSSC